MKPDFSGYATKSGVECSDGLTIDKAAFKHADGKKLPLVWAHDHSTPENVLGHVMVEHREDGSYVYGFFNDTPSGKIAKTMVEHKDLDALSIYANRLTKGGPNGRLVQHGELKEVSLVLAGANPEAFIEEVYIRHSDDTLELSETEGIIRFFEGIKLEHSDESAKDESEEAKKEESEVKDQPIVVPEPIPAVIPDPSTSTTADESVVEHADDTKETKVADTKEKTVEDVFNEFTDEQKNVVYYMIGAATDDLAQSDLEGNEMTRNAFEQNELGGNTKTATLSHSEFKAIIDDASKFNGSIKESFLAHAGEYGIDDIEYLFPDAQTLTSTPEFLSRRMEWVDSVLSSVRRTPFARIKTVLADITADEARAKGYVKGNMKKDEVIRLLKRTTNPKTIYKKQKLDRDDIVDITGLDVVVWIKQEMRIMLDEEVAAAILVGDGRESDDEDKIDEESLRPIAYDVDMYNTSIELDAGLTPSQLTDAILRGRKNYKGTGTPTFYTTEDVLTDLILQKDTLGRRLYDTNESLSAALRVKAVIPVEAMERAAEVVGVMVNLADYSVGADKGGELNWFDDFDIDYNQLKWLGETRISGALTRPKSAVTFKANSGTVVTPNAPTFVPATGIVTIPTQTGVVYKNKATGVTLSAGAQNAIAAGTSVEIEAVPTTGYSFNHGFDADWEFVRPSA
jgi:HK97 family phage prohead protease